MQTFTDLPQDLPVPKDDGSCAHLLGISLPKVMLLSTDDRELHLSDIKGQVVLYCYPMTGQPGIPLPNGWDQIPGARGCTPQACSFRDYYAELQALDVQVYGISTQDTRYQKEAVERLHLPFELLSDAGLEFSASLQLPTFEVDGKRLIKRLTIIANEGKIIKVFYPVFPPDKHAQEVVEWLASGRV
jgi:peroxiredoxin